MRIGHFMNGIWQSGGKASYILRTAAAQAEAGHEVFLLDTAPVPPGQTPPADLPHAVVQSLDALRDRAGTYRLDIVNTHTALAEAPVGDVPFVRTVHIHNPYCPSGTRYFGRWQKPCDRAYSVSGCLWGHVVDRCGSVRPRGMYRHFKRIGRQRQVHQRMPVIAVSQFVKDQMIRSGYDGAQITVVHSPAPQTAEAYVPPPQKDEAPRFLYMGRIVPQKGVSWLLKAFAKLEYPELKSPVHLDIAGDGDQRAEMVELAKSLDVADRVTFHGWVSSEQVNTLIQAARAVVFPSVWHEPAGLVTLEAAAMGRPVIASRTGGIPEYASEEYALLVPPNDVAALASCISRLADNRALAERMGRRGRQIIQERFAMENFIRRLDDIYGAIIGGAAAGASRQTTKHAVE